MKYVLNGISHFDFFDGLEKHHATILQVLEAESDDVKAFKEKADYLIAEAEKYISAFILPTGEEILYLSDNGYDRMFDYDYFEYGLEKPPEVKKEIERLERFGKSFRKIISYLSMAETLREPDVIIQIENISDKNDFILSKLNSVFSDETYSIQTIFDLNNIGYREDETREIALELSKRGYLILDGRYKSDSAKISVKGATHIERKLKQKTATRTKNELDKKIDTILAHLTTLGYGQEIIFNEIDELRALQHKLSKRSWSQLLKGKLVDLALDKLISVDIAKSVYEYLTSTDFKLLR